MNRTIKQTVVFMMVFTLLSGSVLLSQGFVKAAGTDIIRNDETGIPDRALYQLILKALNKTPDSTFTEAEAQSVSAVLQDVFREGDSDRKEEEQVVSLQGIEKLTNLKNLSLGKNKITDLKPLESLTKLTGLGLTYSYSITSIEGLRGLTWLEFLSLPPTVTDLSPVEGMKGLREFRVAAGIRALPDLTGHTKLTCPGTQLWGNNLTKSELAKKLPKQVLKNKKWLRHTVDLQEYNVKKMVKAFKLTAPKKVTGINRKTKTITGKVDKRTYARLVHPHSDHMQGATVGHWRFNKNGVFKAKINLKKYMKKYKKKQVWLELYYKSRYPTDEASPVLLKRFKVTLKNRG